MPTCKHNNAMMYCHHIDMLYFWHCTTVLGPWFHVLLSALYCCVNILLLYCQYCTTVSASYCYGILPALYFQHEHLAAMFSSHTCTFVFNHNATLYSHSRAAEFTSFPIDLTMMLKLMMAIMVIIITISTTTTTTTTKAAKSTTISS